MGLGNGPRGSGARTSDIPKHVTNVKFENFGDFLQRLQGDLLLRPLNLPDVISIQISFFGQLFLAPASFSAFGADGLPHGPINFGKRRHGL